MCITFKFREFTSSSYAFHVFLRAKKSHSIKCTNITSSLKCVLSYNTWKYSKTKLKINQIISNNETAIKNTSPLQETIVLVDSVTHNKRFLWLWTNKSNGKKVLKSGGKIRILSGLNIDTFCIYRFLKNWPFNTCSKKSLYPI